MTYHETPHTVPYTRAMAFIASHGHFAAITKDGLLALSEVHDSKAPEGDAWHEEPQLFPVDAEGRVSSKAVRDWLGY